ncbi:hypothetical protein [Kutzneria sp. 744]|uniref:hypothetical protein n=1 Tax=Kutzneria sp. (strain 744) TaxID=345341 RepID=UPI0003EEC488|nr:hypothetical protein [Kutzneria sp. 744]EWM16807.1 hypothetical protein KUTG_07111 [Kutzneria sp. 744]
MSWTDFKTDAALELDLLQRAAPLVPTRGSGDARATLDIATGKIHAAVSVVDFLGPSAESCVGLLRIRPLLIGAAWKVLDLFLEEAFRQVGEQPDQSRGFSIKHKRKLARDFVGAPAFLPQDVWQAVALTYDQTADLRDSLVHRRVHLDGADTLIGRDSKGGKLRPMSAAEQEAFVHAVLRLAEAADHQRSDLRTVADLSAQFSTLKALHKVALPGTGTPIESIPELTVIVDPESDGSGYLLDMPYIRTRTPWQGSLYCDLIVTFRDRPGQNLHGHLEEAPEKIVLVDPGQPPSWLA